MNTRHRNAAGPQGFASCELLIVIALIAVLIAILFPVLAEVRDACRGRICAAELRDIGVGLAAYAADHDGRYPPAVVRRADGAVTDTWATLALAGRGRPRCPEADGAGLPYALNTSLTGVETTSVRAPGRTVLACDARFGILALGGPDTSGSLQRPSTLALQPDLAASFPPGATRHRRRGNYLFADGHVQRLKPEDAAFAP
jgi:prepilin-type processing-associated H-X9-DG protein